MATRFLEQIVPAPTPAVITDQLVGVQGGINDVLFPVGNISGLPLASSDPRFFAPFGELQLYVATAANGGKDSNPGTLAQPYLTIKRALREAGKFDYGYGNEPSIFVGPGTFLEPGGTFGEAALNLPNLVNCQALDSGLIDGAAGWTSGTTTITTSGSPFTFIQAGSSRMSAWRVGDMTIDCPGLVVFCLGGEVELFNTTIADSTAGGQTIVARVQEGGEFFTSGNITLTAPGIKYFMQVVYNGRGFMFTDTNLTLPAALTINNSFLQCVQNGSITFIPNSITNQGGATGNIVTCTEGSTIFTTNGLLSDIPGSTFDHTRVDTTSGIIRCLSTSLGFDNLGAFFATYFAEQTPAIPTTANISPGMWTVVKDTGGGGVYVMYNDAGTIKKVALV